MKHVSLIVSVGLIIFTCTSKPDTKSSYGISGVYATEYSFKVVNLETGAEIGTRTIRDTIFVRAVQDGYEISNRKWRKNDYDTEGWQNMMHSEDRPMPTYLAIYVGKDGRLNPQETGLAPILYADPSKQIISKGLNESQRYLKAK